MRATRTSPGTPAGPAAATAYRPSGLGATQSPGWASPAPLGDGSDAAEALAASYPGSGYRLVDSVVRGGPVAPALALDEPAHLETHQGGDGLRRAEAGSARDLLGHHRSLQHGHNEGFRRGQPLGRDGTLARLDPEVVE